MHRTSRITGEVGLAAVAAALIAAAIGAVAGFLGTVVTPVWTAHAKRTSERSALQSEAAYICHAMAWQVQYLAGDQTPEKWRDAQVPPNLPYIDKPDRAWRRPLLPFRTPVWSKLKDKIGDLDERNAIAVTDFYNRAEFLNALLGAQHCFEKDRGRFWTLYMCSLRNELGNCAQNDFDKNAVLSAGYGNIVTAMDGICYMWNDQDSGAPIPPDCMGASKPADKAGKADE